MLVKVRKQIDETNWDEATSFSDSLGRTIKTVAKDSQGDVIVETKYDNLGRVKATSNPYRSGDTVYWSKPRYDELNRVVETFAPALENQTGASLGITEWGISTEPDFVGTFTIATDASGRKARSITNSLGQLIRIDEPTGTNNDLGSLGEPNQPTFYKYNPQGKMVHVQQGKTGERAIQHRYFLYDFLGRLIRVKQPEQEVNTALNIPDPVTTNSVWTAAMEYDLVGNLIKTTDAENKQITNTYDKAGRVKVRSYSNLDTPSVYYYYDGMGLSAPPPTTNNFAKGKLTKVSSSISATQFTSFDNFGRTLASQQITDGNTYESKYKYDFGGRMVEQTYPSGKVVRNFFESDGDLNKIVRQGKVYASDFAYTATGSYDRLKLGNGRWESWKYNSRLQLTEIALGTQPTDGSLWKQNYEFGEIDANGNVNTSKNTGNIAKLTNSFNGLAQPFVQTFKYDSLNRVTEAKELNNGTTTWQQAWDYDRFGNRTAFNSQAIGQTAITTTPNIDQNTNRFVSGVQYDKAGNIVQDSVNGQLRNFVFNGDNKQVHVKDANNIPIGTYYYDGNGARVKKSTASETTIFVYDSGGLLVAEYSTATPTQTPTVSYTATDTLGSPRVITDKQGNVTSRRDFLPFGEELIPDGTFRTTANKFTFGEDNVRKRFTGYEKDQETGLDFAQARYYNNKHGRFTAVDPLLASGKSSNPQSFNRYAYTMNQPLSMTDKTGLQSEPTTDFWTVRDTNKGRTFYKATSEIDRQMKGAVWGGNFERYKGNDFYIFNPDTAGTAIFLGQNGSGKGYSFPTSTIPRDQLDSLIATQESGQAFSEEQSMTLTSAWMDKFARGDLEVDLKVKLPASLAGGLGGAAERGIVACSTSLFSNSSKIASSAGGAIQPMSFVRNIEKGEKLASIINEGKALTFTTGNEAALVKLANGSRALVTGGHGGISFSPGQVTRIFGHSHPTLAPPSLSDILATRALGNSRQFVFHGGLGTSVRASGTCSPFSIPR